MAHIASLFCLQHEKQNILECAHPLTLRDANVKAITLSLQFVAKILYQTL